MFLSECSEKTMRAKRIGEKQWILHRKPLFFNAIVYIFKNNPHLLVILNENYDIL